MSPHRRARRRDRPPPGIRCRPVDRERPDSCKERHVARLVITHQPFRECGRITQAVGGLDILEPEHVADREGTIISRRRGAGGRAITDRGGEPAGRGVRIAGTDETWHRRLARYLRPGRGRGGEWGSSSPVRSGSCRLPGASAAGPAISLHLAQQRARKHGDGRQMVVQSDRKSPGPCRSGRDFDGTIASEPVLSLAAQSLARTRRR